MKKTGKLRPAGGRGADLAYRTGWETEHFAQVRTQRRQANKAAKAARRKNRGK